MCYYTCNKLVFCGKKLQPVVDKYPIRDHVSDFASLDYSGWLRAYGIDTDLISHDAYSSIRKWHRGERSKTDDELAHSDRCLTAAPAATHSLKKQLAKNNMDMRAYTEAHSFFTRDGGFNPHDFTVLVPSRNRQPSGRDMVICTTYKQFLPSHTWADLPNIVVGRRSAVAEYMATHSDRPHVASNVFAVDSLDARRSRSHGTEPHLWGNLLREAITTNPMTLSVGYMAVGTGQVGDLAAE